MLILKFTCLNNFIIEIILSIIKNGRTINHSIREY